MRRLLALAAAVLVLAGCNSEPDTTFLEDAWDHLGSDNQVLFCLAWELDSDALVGSTFEHLPDDVDLSRQDVVGFYDGKCD